jgi:hypothetical protein
MGLPPLARLAGGRAVGGPGRPPGTLLLHRFCLAVAVTLAVSLMLMHRRPLRDTARLAQEVAAVDPDLIKFEKTADGLGVALPGLIEEPPPLIQFFFFGMRGRPPFHLWDPFSTP